MILGSTETSIIYTCYILYIYTYLGVQNLEAALYLHMLFRFGMNKKFKNLFII